MAGIFRLVAIIYPGHVFICTYLISVRNLTDLIPSAACEEDV